jgi:hypothetical protein
MGSWQKEYKTAKESFEESKSYVDFINQSDKPLMFTYSTSYNLAHWFLAFGYLVVSFRIELKTKNLPEETHNCKLNTVNILVCLFIVVIPAISWICFHDQEIPKNEIVFEAVIFGVTIFSLVLSCIALVWSICKLARLVSSKRGVMVNKKVVIMHIVCYLATLIVIGVTFK